MQLNEMYYKRIISNKLQQLLMCGGELHWLYRLVKENEFFDFLIGANCSREWISVYCGTTKLLKITFNQNKVRISADHKYDAYAEKHKLNIYGVKKTTDLSFEKDLIQLVSLLQKDKQLDRYYFNRKEGYFQNLFSRQFGICSNGNENFVVIDKESVIGYRDGQTKKNYFHKQKEKFMSIYEYMSQKNKNLFGKNLPDKALGNEVDFLAVNRNGDVLLIEFKHGSSAKGIYLSPIQIGLYCSLFQDYIDLYKQSFINDVGEMIKQKKTMGLISPDFPEVVLSGKIIPMLVIAEFNPKSSALETFGKVLQICRENFKDNTWLSNLEMYEFNEHQELKRIQY